MVYRATVGAGVLGVGGGNERRQIPGTSKEQARNILGTCLEHACYYGIAIAILGTRGGMKKEECRMKKLGPKAAWKAGQGVLLVLVSLGL
jgi:hypothetical protein